jgi:hypothetical protein
MTLTDPRPATPEGRLPPEKTAFLYLTRLSAGTRFIAAAPAAAMTASIATETDERSAVRLSLGRGWTGGEGADETEGGGGLG